MTSALEELDAYTERLDRQREAEATVPSLSGPEDQEEDDAVVAGAAIFYGPAAEAREPEATTEPEDGAGAGEAGAEEIPRTAFRARHEAMLRRFAGERTEVPDDDGKKSSVREAEARGDRRATHPHSVSSKSTLRIPSESEYKSHGEWSAPDSGADAEDRLVPDVTDDVQDEEGADGDWDTLPDWDVDLEGDYDDTLADGGDGDGGDGGDAEGGGADSREPSRLWTETEVDFRSATKRAFPKARRAGRDAFEAVAERTAPLRGERPIRWDSRELGGGGPRP